MAHIFVGHLTFRRKRDGGECGEGPVRYRDGLR